MHRKNAFLARQRKDEVAPVDESAEKMQRIEAVAKTAAKKPRVKKPAKKKARAKRARTV